MFARQRQVRNFTIQQYCSLITRREKKSSGPARTKNERGLKVIFGLMVNWHTKKRRESEQKEPKRENIYLD